MYWNPIENYDRYEDISININMRCIEIKGWQKNVGVVL